MTRHLSVSTSAARVAFGLALAAFSACNVPSLPDQQSADKPAAGKPAAVPAAAATATDNPAAEALVLIQDNKERCLRVSRDAAKVMEDAEAAPAGERYARTSGDSPRAQLRKYLESEVKSESYLIKAVEEIIRQSLSRMDRNQQRDLSIQMRSLFEAQQQLCRASSRSYVSSVEDYRGEVSASLYSYSQTEQRITSFFRVTDAERQRIHRQHEAALVAMAQAVGGSYRPMVMGAGAYPARQKSSEEWERERKEYEEKLRRREQMQAEHQRSVGAWRDRGQDRETPSAGVSSQPTMVATPVLKPQAAVTPRQKQMVAWHKDYAVKSYPAKLAIQRYLQALQSRNLQVIEPACRDLKAACDQLLAKRGVLYAPDPEVQRDLEEAYSRFQMVGTTCRDEQATSAARAFDRANATLRTYGLQP